MAFRTTKRVYTAAQQGAEHTPARNPASATIPTPVRASLAPLSRWPRSSRSPTSGACRPASRRAVARRRRRDRAPRPRPLVDARGRGLRDLRISVTDRCNFRCVYCMPKEVFGRDYAFLPHAELLTLRGDRARSRASSSAHGVEKIRLTGGEPLLRRERRAPGRDARRRSRRPRPHADHQRLAARAEGARAAGRRPAARHRQPRLARRRDLPRDERRRLPGRQRARGHRRRRRGRPRAGQGQHGRQARRQRRQRSCRWRATSAARGHILRFIEYMDVGATNGWRMDDVCRRAEVVRRDRRRAAARAGRPQLPRRGRRALALPRRRAARSASSPR